MKKILILVCIVVIAVVGWRFFGSSFGNKSLFGSKDVENIDEPSSVAKTSVVILPKSEVAKDVKVQLDALKSGDKIASPVTITGKARGPWYFEASFPVELRDSNNLLLAQKPAQATSDWMTTNWVPFTVTLSFPTPATATGTLIFRKDNPSGEPINDDQFSIEVQF